MKKAFIVIGIQGGDEGKGGVVHKLSIATKAHTVIKVGGAQGSHGVKTTSGESFAFSQLGCGTFEGVATHISCNFVLDPNALINEVEAFESQFQLHIHGLVTIDERALCNTPFHRLTSRLSELARKDKPRGTVGTGVGRTCLDAIQHPHLIIRAGDLLLPYEALYEKIEAVRIQKLDELRPIIEEVETLLNEDKDEAKKMIGHLQDVSYSTWITDRFKEMAAKFKIVSSTFLGEEILSREGRVIIESSHGVLNDKYYGFHPHTTQLRILPISSIHMLEEAGYTGEIKVIGVTRAYGIRHGAGPFVTEDPTMIDQLLPSSNKEENRFQGKVRVGALDYVALRYAIKVCGGSETFEGLAITWFDQITANGTWSVCNKYQHPDSSEYFSIDGDLVPQHNEDLSQLHRQERLGKLLHECLPIVSIHAINPLENRQQLVELCAREITNNLNTRVRMISFGPTEKDTVLL